VRHKSCDVDELPDVRANKIRFPREDGVRRGSHPYLNAAMCRSHGSPVRELVIQNDDIPNYRYAIRMTRMPFALPACYGVARSGQHM